MKTFYSCKKIPLIPPLLINDQLITDFRGIANFFKLHFTKQCTPIEKESSIPTEAVDFENQDILKIIWDFDINKAHDLDNILTIP